MQMSPRLHSITPAQTCFIYTQLTKVVNATLWQMEILDEFI